MRLAQQGAECESIGVETTIIRVCVQSIESNLGLKLKSPKSQSQLLQRQANNTSATCHIRLCQGDLLWLTRLRLCCSAGDSKGSSIVRRTCHDIWHACSAIPEYTCSAAERRAHLWVHDAGDEGPHAPPPIAPTQHSQIGHKTHPLQSSTPPAPQTCCHDCPLTLDKSRGLCKACA